MWRYSYNLRSIYETPSLPVASEAEATNQRHATELIEAVREKGRTIYLLSSSPAGLAAYGISVPTMLFNSPDEAVSIAKEIGYPVVPAELRNHHPQIGRAGRAVSNLGDDDVRKAYQTIDTTVGERAGPGHFQGVTVQLMEKLDATS